MPITKNTKLKDLEFQMIKQVKIKKEEYALLNINYSFYENKPEEYQENVRLLILYEDNHVFFFITSC